MTTQQDVINSANMALQTINSNFAYLNEKTDNITSANNAALTIQKNGTTIGTFTANASSPVTVNVAVPVNVTDLADSSNYPLKSNVYTKTEIDSCLSNCFNVTITDLNPSS